jgi:serine/threonine protein kinase
MGQVYRATDTLLGRQVAVKILPDAFAADPERLARFEREARTLATLNHPNIATIYAVERSAGVQALVMELVEGDDLSQRIARGALPLEEARSIGIQIASALEAAHDEGIVHRDLKPANIRVRPDGTVKVLDFGLAKALEPAALAGDPSYALTISSPAILTGAAVILGTAAYMAPEQARGQTVDRRADIWALGAVLFEMLTGTRAFKGQDIVETLAAVINQEPDWTRLPAALPPALGTYLRRCLEKNPKQRFADAQDVRLALEGAFDAPPVTPALTATLSDGRRAWGAAIVFALMAAAIAVPAVRHLRENAPALPLETRLDIVTPSTEYPEDFALSPDGRQVVFVASGDGSPRLWVRSLDGTVAQPLAGTESGSAPFWSPDGRAIGFFADGSLKRINATGGSPQTLAPVTGRSRGGTWNADGIILFAASEAGPLFRVRESGGEVNAVTKLDRHRTHRWPVFLPDGRHFLFAAVGQPNVDGIHLGSLDSQAITRLTTTPADLNESAGAYLPDTSGSAGAGASGWVLFVRTGTLVAQRLDLEKRLLTGDPVTLANPVAVNVPTGQGALSVSASGVIAYRARTSDTSQLQWFDRAGKAVGTLGAPDNGRLATPAVSPDGRRAAVYRNTEGNGDLWLLDGIRASKLTFDAAIEGFPLWSPNGQSIVFRSRRTGTWDLFQKSSSGAGAEERLLESAQTKTPLGWSADGRFLLYQSADPQSDNDLWLLPMNGRSRSGSPTVFLKTPFAERWARFSPDGRWVAYQSNEAGRDDIYIRPFREPAGPGSSGQNPATADAQWPVSNAGGIHPRWGPYGRELYYLNPAGDMMGASISVSGGVITVGAPVVLFHTRISGGGTDQNQGPQFDVASDGRFLIVNRLDSGAAPITLLQHWNPGQGK